MKKVLLTVLFAALALATYASGEARVYGLRVYSTQGEQRELVSFPLSNPGAISQELDLSEYYFRAGVSDGEYLYMVYSADGISTTGMAKMELASKKVTRMVDYNWHTDLAGNLLLMDMAYNPVDGKIYGGGYDLTDAVISQDEMDAQYGLYIFDPETGQATTVGRQDNVAFISLTFSNEGDLFGLDESGRLWTINTANGRPGDILFSTGISPIGQQSMTTDRATNKIYWASYTERSGEGYGRLVEISHTDDWVFSQTIIGQLQDDSELVGLYIDDNPVGEKAPMNPTGFTVKEAANGGLSATLSWTNPTLARNGNALTNLTVKVYRGNEVVKTVTGLTPGAAGSYVDVPTQADVYTYSIAACEGDEEGERVFAEPLFVGTDVPGEVKELTVERGSGYDVHISWQAPTKGANGGWFDSSNLTYNIIRQPGAVVVAQGQKETTVTDKSITTLAGYTYEVTAVAGTLAGATTVSHPLVCGPAKELPYAMNLDDEEDAALWTTLNYDGDEYEWYMDSNWGGTLETFYRYYPSEIFSASVAVDDWLVSPHFSLSASKYYVLKYQVRLLGSLFPVSYAVTMGTGSTPDKLTTVLEQRDNVTNDIVWESRALTFRPEADGEYNFAFQIQCANPIQIYKVEIREIGATDIAAGALEGNASAGKGVEGTYTLNVLNEGFLPISKFTAGLTDETGKVLVSKEFEQTIEPQQSVKVQLSWTAESAGRATLCGTVSCEGDEIADNNQGEAFEVAVMSDGRWQDVLDGKSYTANSPFYLPSLYSACQTIFTAEELGGVAASIEGITYPYLTMGSRTPAPFTARVSLANVTVSNFSDGSLVAPTSYTKVYEGTVQLEAGQHTLAIVFDEPFAYTGGNLAVYTSHQSEETSSVVFQSANNSGAARTLLYRSNDAPFDFISSACELYDDRTNASFYMADPSGVESAVVDAEELGLRYDRAGAEVKVNEVAEISVYSLQGVLLARGTGLELSTAGLSGAAVVTATTARGTAVLKVVL